MPDIRQRRGELGAQCGHDFVAHDVKRLSDCHCVFVILRFDTFDRCIYCISSSVGIVNLREMIMSADMADSACLRGSELTAIAQFFHDIYLVNEVIPGILSAEPA